MRFLLVFFITFFSVSSDQSLRAQQKDFSGVEVSVDQDRFVDFLRQQPYERDNHTIGLRIGFYGKAANHTYLGLPWVRENIDAFLIDNLLHNRGFQPEVISHNFAITINGFSPSYISDQTLLFDAAQLSGYDFLQDRPFSSFTGIRSSRRLEGSKLFAHSAHRLDMAISTSFTFGFASFGMIQGIENLFGGNRPEANLWKRDETKVYPTGQTMPKGLPVLMYSFSYEAVVLRPIRKIVIQLRPEVNLGTYTNVGVGMDIGKVMNVEKNVDNLGYTDANNPSLLKVNNENIGIAISAGFTARAVLYNAHLNGIYSANPDHYISLQDTRKLVLETYVGAKIQLLKKIEFSMSINSRTSEFKLAEKKTPYWGTLGMKYLIAPEGEGCYD